jgi:hypothetical protein
MKKAGKLLLWMMEALIIHIVLQWITPGDFQISGTCFIRTGSSAYPAMPVYWLHPAVISLSLIPMMNTCPHLRNAREILTANPEIDLLHGCAEIVGNPYVNDALNPGRLIHIDECVIGGTFFVKKVKAIEFDGFPDQNFADDFDFYRKAESAGFRIMKTDVRTYRYYRDTPGAING